LTQRPDKKKESRKSARTSHKSDKKKSSVRDIEKLIDEQTIQAAGPILEEISNSFHRELNYQNELLDYMKEESQFLKRKIQEETEKCSNILEQFELEMAAIRKATEEERRERRQLQFTLENLQNNINSTPPSSTTKANPKTQNSKTKRPQKNKKNPN